MIDFSCMDCGVDTHKIGEYYMVKDDVWESAVSGRALLCVGCLETRLGRRLLSADFSNALINSHPNIRQSERLQSRLSDGPKTT
jgi:hypothetical protein